MHLREDPDVPNDIVRIDKKWLQMPEPKYGADAEDTEEASQEEEYLQSLRLRRAPTRAK